MNKLSAFFIVLLLLSSLPADARTVYSPPYPPYSDSGTRQYYSVIFDDEEEAAVAARITVQNAFDANLTQLTVEIPGTNVRLLNALQEVRQQRKYCSRWEDVCLNYSDGVCSSYIRQCSYWQTDYYGSSPVFYSLDKTVEQLSFSAKYTIKLDVPVAPTEQATVILYYKATGLAKRSMGVSNFAFETVKVPYDTESVRAAVNVQPDSHLKGAKASVRTLPNFEVASSFASKGVESAELSSLSSSITYQPGYVKQSYSLDPWESFVVRGSYSESWLALYWKNVMLWVLGVAAGLVSFGALLVFAVRKAKKAPLAKVLLLSVVSGISTVALLSLLSVLLLLAGSSYSARALVPLILLLMLVIFVAGFFIPSIYAASRHGFGMGALAFIVSLFIMAAVVVLLFFLLMLFSQPYYYALAESVAAIS